MVLPLLITISLLTPPGTCPPGNIHCQQEIVGTTVWHQHDEAVLAAFDKSIQDYRDLHRRLARATPPLQVTADPAQLRNAVDSLGQAIRLARPTARPGNVFTEAVANMFRRRIDCALCRVDVMALIAEMGEDAEPNAPPPVVNGPFPWRSGNAIWPSVLAVLPELPEELHYGFVGVDLVLIDIRANVVVDILEGALTPTS